MTDQTLKDSSEPTTNEGLGVVGAQMAAAEQSRKQEPVPPSTAITREDTLAIEALRLAIQQGETADETVKRAGQYLEFLKGNDNG